MKLKLNLPNPDYIKQLIDKTLNAGPFSLDDETKLDDIIHTAQGLSYYSIQRTLIGAIKSSLFDLDKKTTQLNPVINTNFWINAIEEEKKQQSI